MIIDPEVRIAGQLRESLEKLRAVSDDRQLCAWMEAGLEHASFHMLVDAGVRGLERYLTNSDSVRIGPRGSRVGEGKPGRGLRKPEGGREASPDGLALTADGEEEDLKLAERSLAVIDAALSSVAHSPNFESSLAVQEGLTHIRNRIHVAVQTLREKDHRGYLEKLAESLCRELSLRSSHPGGR